MGQVEESILRSGLKFKGGRKRRSDIRTMRSGARAKLSSIKMKPKRRIIEMTKKEKIIEIIERHAGERYVDRSQAIESTIIALNKVYGITISDLEK